MELEKLNTSQVVLLTLFTSFVTSIATGIVTISLMEKAPPTITETVNRVIERTVEKVVPGETAAAAVPVEKTVDKTVVLSEGDAIAKAVEIISPSIVHIYSKGSEADPAVFLGVGVVLNSSGDIITDANVVGDRTDISIELSGSLRIAGTISGESTTTGIAYIKSATSSESGSIVSWKGATFADANPTIGSTVIVIAGKSGMRIDQGIVSELSSLSDSVQSGVIDTNLPAESILPGSPILDTTGRIIGMRTGLAAAAAPDGFLAAPLIKAPSPSQTTLQAN